MMWFAEAMSGPPLHVVLYQPEIPFNTGNVGRTCVALGAKLWLVRPLGFRLDDRQAAPGRLGLLATPDVGSSRRLGGPAGTDWREPYVVPHQDGQEMLLRCPVRAWRCTGVRQ